MRKIKKHVKKHFHFWTLLISFFIVAPLFLAQTSNITADTTTNSTMSISGTMTLPTCVYSCEIWSECSSTGVQTCKKIVKSPQECLGGVMIETTRPCFYQPPACTYEYSSWGPCQPDGYQFRNVISANPPGCVGEPILRQRCTYVSPSPTPYSAPNCVYSYSDWGACQPDGYQYRSVISKSPSECVGSPITRQSCKYSSSTSTSSTATDSTSSYSSPPCVFTYGEWQTCQPDGFQYRTYTASPSGCTGNPYNKRPCTYSASTSGDTSVSTNQFSSSTATSFSQDSCVFNCTAWSACNWMNYQTRKCQKPSFDKCVNYEEKRFCVYTSNQSNSSAHGAVSDLSSCRQECSNWSICSPNGMTYRYCWPSPSGCPGEKTTETQSCKPLICSFAYSPWSECRDGYQHRLVLDQFPAGCVGGDPEIVRECKVSAIRPGEAVLTESKIESPLIAASKIPLDPDNVVKNDWKMVKFKTADCYQDICGGLADPDKDGLNNNDEQRYQTEPTNPDTDQDGKRDGEEIAAGTDPLRSSADGKSDEISYENPQKAGVHKPDIYKVEKVEMVEGKNGSKALKISGKGPALSYVTIYIFSEPLVLTVKTDKLGNWYYTLEDPLEDGRHEVYVAITDNAGKIKSKSSPLPFVKTAEAVTLVGEKEVNPAQEVNRRPGIHISTLLLILAVAMAAFVVALILIGWLVKKTVDKINLN